MRALDVFKNVSPFGQAHCRRGLGEVCVELGSLSEAEQHFSAAMTLYDEARKNPSLGVGLVELGRGRLAVASDDLVTALEHFRCAADMFQQRRLNEPFELGQAYELIGKVLRRSYQVEDAIGNFELALRQYEQCGCELPSARFENWLSGSGAFLTEGRLFEESLLAFHPVSSSSAGLSLRSQQPIQTISENNLL